MLTNWEFVLRASINNEHWPAAGCTNQGQLSYSLPISAHPKPLKLEIWKLETWELNWQNRFNEVKNPKELEPVSSKVHYLRGNIFAPNFWHQFFFHSLLVPLLITTGQAPDVWRRTCLYFGVVAPLRHLLLADEVINDPHSDWRLGVVPLHDDQRAAGLIRVRQLQPGDTERRR